jgi:hypothetical protein
LPGPADDEGEDRLILRLAKAGLLPRRRRDRR